MLLGLDFDTHFVKSITMLQHKEMEQEAECSFNALQRYFEDQKLRLPN
jgi:hypothetical protein